MSAMRKKTLLELMQERAEQNLNQQINTSAYTDKPRSANNNSEIKTKVDSMFRTNQNNNEDDIFGRTANTARKILNDSNNIKNNFMLGIKKAGESSLSYIEEVSNQNSNTYARYNKQNAKIKKNRELNQNILNGKNSNKGILPNKDNLRAQGSKTSIDNAIVTSLKESQKLESPITEYINEIIENDEQKIEQNIENSETKVGKKLAEVTPSIGQSVTGMAVSTINPALGISFWQTSAGGDYTREAKSKGLNDKKAMLYGTIMGSMESATEAIGAKLTTGVGKAVFKDGAKEGFKAFGLDVAENFFEEAIMEPVQETVMKITGGEADWSNIGQRMWDSGINGALTSVIMGGASAGIGKATKIITKMENNQQVSSKELIDTLKEINDSEEVDIEKILVDSFKFTAQDLIKNIDVEKNTNNKIENIAGQLSKSEINNLLSSKKDTTIKNNEVLNNNQQIIPDNANMPQNSISERIEGINKSEVELTQENNQKLEKVLQKDKYKNNNKAKNFFKSAIENNLDVSNEKIEALYDLPNARGIETEFNSKYFEDGNGKIRENINALYVTDREGKRSIIYNPKAQEKSIIEKNAIHETFHDMAGTKESKEVIDFVYDRIKDSVDFHEAYESLKEAYANVKDVDGNILYNKNSKEFENMIKEEAIADYLGTNLGNQEYINELVNGKESRNIAQKIYDAIVSFLDKVTGYKTEEAYLRGLKEKFEKAFNAEYTNQGENSKFSIGGIKGVKNINDLNIRKNALDMYSEAKKMIKEKKSNAEIFKKTGWFRDNVTGELKFNFSDKDMELISHKYQEGQEYKLKEVLKHDLLFEIYPQLEDYKVKIADLRKETGRNVSGRYNTLDNIIEIDAKRFNDKADVEGTFIHEVQHAIQKIEGFAQGTSSKKGKKYRKNFGEVEARDTSIRFLLEKYKNKDLSNRLPKSANIKANILDKMKVGLYNYISNIMEEGDSNEVTENNQKKIPATKKENSKSGHILGGIENSKQSSFSMIRYSNSNIGKWEEFLEKYKKNNGTRTTLGEIKLPKKKEIKMPQNLNKTEVISMPIDKVLQYKTDGGHRAEETINKLKEDIKSNGIQNPIELIRDEDGKIKINNGNHRLEIAKQLGLKDVPVTYKDYANIDKIDKSMYDANDKDILKYAEEHKLGSNRNSKEIAMANGRSWIEQGDDSSNRVKYENEGTAGRNDSIYKQTQGIYNGPSNTTTSTKDTVQGLEESSSFNLQENNPTVKAQNYERRQRNNFKKNMSSMLGISQYNANNKTLFDTAINNIREEYNKTGKISDKSRKAIFNNLYNNLIKEDRAFYDENKNIKDEIRTTKLYIDDNIKRDIVDYNDFRKNSMGSVFLTSDENNIPVDTYYEELTETNPILFPDTIVNPSDQLKRIVEVSKSIRKSERNISVYNDKFMSKEYQFYAENEFNQNTDRLIEQFKFIDKYNQEKIKENIKEDYTRPEVEEIRFIYENRNKLQKEVEKQEKNLLLTNREKAIVDRLLKDEMDINEILPGLNKAGIVKSYYARQQLDYMKEQIKQYKNDVKQNLKDVADSLTIDADKWKDKKAGIWYARETAIRNIQDIMSKESADRITKELFEPIIHNTSEQTRFLNNYVETIENLKLDKKLKYDWNDETGKKIKIDEATLAQLLIEKAIDNNYLKGIGANVERINTIANTFENILKETVNQMDDVYVQFGYAPVEKRQNYFPHFIENKPDTFISKFANAFGFEVGQDNLPTDIAGRTETFKPGRAFDRNILQRTTNKTDYNALKALDMYMQGASDIIYHTEDIQKLRAFNDSIRNRFKTSEIQKKLDAINENVELTDEERVFQRQQVKDAIKTPLNNLVTWLDEYTNVIANKKSSADRQMEKDTSRQAYTTMKDIEGKIASNLIGGNVSVALTNFAPLAQATGTTKLGNILIGMVQTTQNTISEMTKGTGDNFVYESDFLTSRRGNNLTQKETFSQNVSNIVSKPMEIIDNFTSESIVRAKYRENIKKGMEHQEALKNADMYARNLMADRSKGAMPTLFNRTNPVTKLLTAFQIEPNNIISNYFKDMPKDSKINKQNLAWQITKLSVASCAFNTILKSIRGGGDVIPNPIGIVSQLIALAMHNLDDNDENDEEVDKVLTSILNDFLGSVPFGNAITTGLTAIGVEGFEDSGKLMVSGAVPNGKKVAKLFDGDVSNEYKKQVIANELTKPLLYLGLPTGGAQVAKTAKGLYSYIQGGSYSYDTEGKKSLQFPVEQNPVNAVKNTVFGKYSLPRAQKYLNNNFDGLNPKQTEVYDNSNIGYDKIKEYFDYSSQKGIKQTNKIEYINKMNLSEEDKWNLYKYNIISNSERKDGSSQLTDAEYAIKNKLTTKSEYMKLLEKATKNNMDFPDKDNLKELKQNGLSLKTYIDYKVNYKNASETKKNKLKHMLPVSEESKNLNLSEKVDLMKNYTTEEKRIIYSNYISKDDDIYKNISILEDGETNIDAYLEYKMQDIKSDEDTKSNIVEKKVSKGEGTSKNKTLEYINNSKLSDIEKLYIVETKYSNVLNNSQKEALLKLVTEKITDEAELEEVVKKFKDMEKHKDTGGYHWK